MRRRGAGSLRVEPTAPPRVAPAGGEVVRSAPIEPTPVVLYIAGTMRSGSTWLSQVLAREFGLLAVGELSMLFQGVVRGDHCSCGLLLAECPVWKQAMGSVTHSDAIDVQERFNDRFRSRRLPRLVLERHLSPAGISPMPAVEAVVNNLLRQHPSGFIDSSKRAGFLFFHAGATRDIRVIHIVRDPLLVAISEKSSLVMAVRASDAPPGSSALKSALQWTASTVITPLACRLLDIPYTCVQYSQMLSDTDGELTRISENLGLLPHRSAGGELFHLAVGNPSRMADPAARPPRTSVDLTPTERLMVRLVTKPARIVHSLQTGRWSR